ncbi:5-methylcytosine restriction system specificity protein McrC [Corynebacterium diphtheriae]
MQTWHAVENEISALPGLTPADVPTGLPDNIRVLLQGGVLQILASNVAGNIPLLNGNKLVISPKHASLNPVSMLLYLHDSQLARLVNDAPFGYSSGSHDFGLSSLAEMLSRELLSFAAKPKLFRRKPTLEATSSAVGQINWPVTNLRARRGDAAPIVTRRHRPTFDIPENRIIKSAAKRVLGLLSSDAPGARVTHDWANWQASTFAGYDDIRKVSQMMRTKNVGGSHSYYSNALGLSLVILQASGIDHGESWESDGYLFNMPGLYEDFVRTSLMRAAEPTALSVQKGFASSSFLLTNGEIELIPDLTIYRGGSIEAVLDVKYKVPDAKDLYQIYTYMQFARLNEAYIISPSVRTGDVVETFDGHRIKCLGLDSSSAIDVDALASRVIEALR